jgi:hypothetical protein
MGKEQEQQKLDMIDAMKKYLKENGTIQTLLACPIATSYFTTFLSTEMSVENLNCYFEAKSLLDLCKYNKKSVMFEFDIINQFEKQAAKMANATNIEHDEKEQCVKELLKPESTSKLTQRKYSQFEKTMEKNRDYSLELILKIQKFLDRYITDTALAEVNIDSKLKKNLIERFEAVKSLREKLIKESQPNSNAENNGNQLKEAIEAFENSFQELITQLQNNMNDAFIRFKASSLCNEALSILLSSEDTNRQREKLLNSEKQGVILNMDVKWTQSPRSPLTTITDLLKSALNVFKSENLWVWSSQLNTIELDSDRFYSSLENVTWKKIADSTSELSKIDLSLLKTDEEKMAFWINVFNLMLIHAALVVRDIPVLDVDIEQFYRKTKYVIGEEEYSLQDIREGILLGNRSKSVIFGKQFKKRDRRKKHMIEKPNVFVIFALSDLLPQSTSIEIMESDKIHEQLQNAVKRYMDNFIHIENENRIIIPLCLARRKHLFKKLNEEIDLDAKSSEEIVIQFVKNHSSILKDKNLADYQVVFERPKPFITNIACVLPDKFRSELEAKLKTSDKSKQEMVAMTHNTLSVPSSDGRPRSKSKKRHSFNQKCSIM